MPRSVVEENDGVCIVSTRCKECAAMLALEANNVVGNVGHMGSCDVLITAPSRDVSFQSNTGVSKLAFPRTLHTLRKQVLRAVYNPRHEGT